MEGASFDDFSQGSLGNCWFVAACACLTADRKLLTKVSFYLYIDRLFILILSLELRKIKAKLFEHAVTNSSISH